MLSKKKRVSRRMFENLNGSRTLSSKSFTLRIIPTNNQTRVAFVVSKKVAKNAVERNKIRRIGYGVVEKIISKLKEGSTFIFYMKKEIATLSKKSFQDEVEHLFNKGSFFIN